MRERHKDYHDQLYVFPSSSKNPATKSPHYNSPREFVASLRMTLEQQSSHKAWDAYAAAFQAKGQEPPLAFEQFAQTYPPQWKFTMHDLRRTFCTVAVNIEGMPYAVVQQLMNHSQMGNVTARYGKPTQEALRKHMQQLENELLRHAVMLPKIPLEA
jgi:integrase